MVNFAYGAFYMMYKGSGTVIAESQIGLFILDYLCAIYLWFNSCKVLFCGANQAQLILRFDLS
jgi:hypothetical protein